MQLEEEIYNYRAHTFSDNTKTTYRTHRNSYMRFCARMGYAPFPAQTAHICLYATYLARTLNLSSIPGYLNIIALLHKEFNLPNLLAIQFREKIVQLPPLYIPGSPLCPATAVQRALSFTRGATPESQAFMWYDLVTQKLTPFTYSQFMRKLRSVEGTNVTTGPKCNKGPKCNNTWS